MKIYKLILIIAGVIVVAYLAGSYFSKETIYQFEEVEVIKEVEKKAPVLDRIADCESGKRDKTGRAIPGSASHYDTNGQVKFYGNKNTSVDIGKYMINNKIWGSKASEMGYNLTDEAQNTLFAEWLFRNYGSSPWDLTKSCWNK